MATVLRDEDSITVSLSAAEKVAAVHGDVTVPRSAVVGPGVVPNGLNEVCGIRAPGTRLPRLAAGTWRHAGEVTFAVCRGGKPAIVLELTGVTYDRLVVTVDDPHALLSTLQ
jgi:hypothetical protein